MDAFAGIGAAGSANLGAVAPGIAEALVATALGLFAAIPAVIGYNHLLNRIKGIGTRLDLFTLEFLSLAERMAVRGR
jgi:biopolymer transport protein TolQ